MLHCHKLKSWGRADLHSMVFLHNAILQYIFSKDPWHSVIPQQFYKIKKILCWKKSKTSRLRILDVALRRVCIPFWVFDIPFFVFGNWNPKSSYVRIPARDQAFDNGILRNKIQQIRKLGYHFFNGQQYVFKWLAVIPDDCNDIDMLCNYNSWEFVALSTASRRQSGLFWGGIYWHSF